jgi:hypothetical protein
VLCERVLHGNTAIPITFVAFDLLRVDGHDVTVTPRYQRRELTEGIWVERRCAQLADVFGDGQVLFDTLVEHWLEGILAKRRSGSTGAVTGAGRRSRTERLMVRSEVELMQRRRERLSPNPA